MELIIHERDDISYVSLEGRLDATGVEEMEQPFEEATTAKGLPTVVDMSGISFMSSLGIGFLFSNTKKLKKAGAKLVLLNPKGMVEDVLRTSKMDKVMPIAYEFDDALRVLEGGKPPARRAAGAEDQATATEPPAKQVPELRLAIKNDVSALPDLYASVEEFLTSLTTPYRAGYTVNLALEELVVNVIRYAYMDFDEHLIDISLSLVDHQLVLVIEDDGRPFDPREGQMLNRHLEDPEVGGLGLILVIEMVDRLSYARVGEKNRTEVRILFADGVPGTEGDADAQADADAEPNSEDAASAVGAAEDNGAAGSEGAEGVEGEVQA